MDQHSKKPGQIGLGLKLALGFAVLAICISGLLTMAMYINVDAGRTHSLQTTLIVFGLSGILAGFLGLFLGRRGKGSLTRRAPPES